AVRKTHDAGRLAPPASCGLTRVSRLSADSLNRSPDSGRLQGQVAHKCLALKFVLSVVTPERVGSRSPGVAQRTPGRGGVPGTAFTPKGLYLRARGSRSAPRDRRRPPEWSLPRRGCISKPGVAQRTPGHQGAPKDFTPKGFHHAGAPRLM